MPFVEIRAQDTTTEPTLVKVVKASSKELFNKAISINTDAFFPRTSRVLLIKSLVLNVKLVVSRSVLM